MELFEEFSQLVAEFKKENIEYALCGGLAMAVYAFPRATLDIDILIEPETLQKTKTMRLSGQDQDDIKNLEGLIDEG